VIFYFFYFNRRFDAAVFWASELQQGAVLVLPLTLALALAQRHRLAVVNRY
jgi:hypothetical protein